MPPHLTFSEASRLAWTLCELAGGESALARTALSWTFRNRLAALEQPRPSCSCADALPDLGHRGAPACEWMAEAALCDFQSADFCLALSCVCMVWSGIQSDPTEGALSFHRHDERPPWARSAEPCALIGSYFFYKGVVEPAVACSMPGGSGGSVIGRGSLKAGGLCMESDW